MSEVRAMGEVAVRTDGLTRVYGRHTALDEVTLTVERGAVYALVGPNGAGKTTLIQMLMNMQQPTSGRAEVLGLPSAAMKGKELARIGYVSENQEVPEWMTVGTMLEYLRPFYPQWDKGLERQLMHEFMLPADRPLKHLSRGMRMKAMFVSSLSYRPELLVLDEPFSGLDPLVRDELIQGLLDRIGETTIFISSHDLAEIESFASHVGYLEQGRLLFSEEMTALSGRYRQMEFQVDGASGMPEAVPDEWMELDRSGVMVRFTHAAFVGDDAAVAEVRRYFPTARDVTMGPMSLRAIFLANARAGKTVRRDAVEMGVRA